MVWQLPTGKLCLNEKTYLMGVINLTPDSFSDGGRYQDPTNALNRAQAMISEGVDIIDLGAESTRPGSAPISVDEECSRLLPALKIIREQLTLPISIDTYKSGVASEALKLGADIINDISGLDFDPNLAPTIAEFRAGCVFMHIKGTPKDMQQDPSYENLWDEIVGYLNKSLARASKAGIKSECIAVDPGIGFGKRLEDNYKIIRELSALKVLGRPIVVGPSRKSFIGLTLNLPVGERQEGSLAAAVLAITNGANILRVHDIRATRRAATLTEAILKGTRNTECS